MALKTTRRVFLAGSAVLAAPQILKIPQALAAPSRLSVWKFGGTPREVELWPVRDKAFAAANPDIALNYAYYYGQIRHQKILAGAQTRQLADVVIGFGQDISEFAGLGIIQPLDPIAGGRIAGWKERIVPEVFASGVREGQVYGLPTYVDMATFLAVDMDALKEAGFSSPPTTWSQLRAYAKAMTKPGRPGIAFPATTAPVDINIFEGIAYANGGRIFDEKSGEVTLAEPGIIDALKLYADLIADGSTPPGASMTETNFRDTSQLFAQKRVAMWIGLSWLSTPWGTPPELNWTGVPFPRPDKVTGHNEPVNALMDPTAILMVSARAQNPEAAVKYLDFWSQDEQLALWGADPEFSRIPAGKIAWKSSKLAEKWPNWVSAYNDHTLFKGAQPLPGFVGASIVENALAVALQKVVLGQKTPEVALAEAAKGAQQQIDPLRR